MFQSHSTVSLRCAVGDKRIWIPALVVIVLLIIGGGIWWHQDRDTAPAQSDCQIAHELVDFKATSVKEQDALLASGADQERLEKYQASVDREQQYVDQIQDPSIQDKAQAVVDADRESYRKQADMYANPATSEPEEREAVAAYQHIAEKFKKAKDELLKTCPAASTDRKL
ncbi:hypothetical protein HBA97_05920 [Mycobacteroides chelonae]|uniref:Uncharacterized protein n=1 Tax=Mycobacteroides chelonae TaxID=1774 RepID=A0A1S1M644_MYCCH|nr:hypothetical protein BKG84_05970 [Mycobacteroides chelonae]QQG90185.1 hypothetical protein HBA99_05920 [Mycobacteroides chelonae]QQG95002.1 hypothetical protein HBA97_05920 [Mycobacteroides chelonae]